MSPFKPEVGYFKDIVNLTNIEEPVEVQLQDGKIMEKQIFSCSTITVFLMVLTVKRIVQKKCCPDPSILLDKNIDLFSFIVLFPQSFKMKIYSNSEVVTLIFNQVFNWSHITWP